MSLCWALSAARTTIASARSHLRGGCGLPDADALGDAAHAVVLTALNHTELMLAAAESHERAAGRPPAQLAVWLLCMRGVMQRVALQLACASVASCCMPAHRWHLLFRFLARVALTLPSVDSELAASILYRSIHMATRLLLLDLSLIHI